MKKTYKILICLTALSFGGVQLQAQSTNPYTDSEMLAVRSKDENKLRQIQEEEIKELRIALGRRLEANRRADLYVRLSEAYMESYRTVFLNEGKAHEKRLQDGQSEKFIDRSRSRPYLRLGIQAAEEVIRLGIAHPKMDQIYYFLGVYNDELENESEVVRYFSQLVNKYPSSPYIGEAYRALAESAYKKRDYSSALGYFQKASQNYKGSAYPRLLHKMAWTQYRLRQFPSAISTMKQAIQLASKDEKSLNLKDEALRDMALFMTEGGQVGEALSYFKSVSGDKDFYAKTLEELASQYERSGEIKKASQVYEYLTQARPDDEASFRSFVKLIEVDLRSKQFGTALNRLGTAKLVKSGDDETELAYKNLKAMVRKTATENHDLYRKTSQKNALLTSEGYYTLYLSKFLKEDSSSAEIPEIQMYLAEVKKDLGKSSEAALLYKNVIQSKDERYAKQAAGLWMVSLSDSIKKAKESKDSAALASLEKDYLEATEAVSETFKGTKEGLVAKLEAATVLAGRSETHSKAEKKLSEIIEQDPGSAQAHRAAQLWIQLRTDRLPKKAEELKSSPETTALLDLFKNLRSQSALMATDASQNKKELALSMDQFEDKIKIGEIAVSEKSQNFTQAGKGYENFANEAEQRTVAEKAYESAISSYLKSTDYESAIKVVSQWSKRYPDSKAPLQLLRTIATSAMITGKFDYSAEVFKILGSKNDPASLEASGRIFEGLGDLTSASEVFKQYLEKFPKGENRGAITLSLAEWYEYSKAEATAIKYYKLCMDEQSPQSAECGMRLYDLYSRMENKDAATRTLKAIADRGSAKKPDPSPYVGYARYLMTEKMELEKKFTSLQLPDDKLKQGLEERLKFLEKLTSSYQNVVEASGPWGVAALDRLAKWVLNFAAEVDAIAPAPNLTKEQIESFRKSLASISQPLRAKALETWKNAYNKALKNELLSPAIPQIADQLNDYQFKAMRRAQGFRDKFRLSGMPANGGEEGSIAAYEKVRSRLLADAKSIQSWIDYGNLLWGSGKPLLARIAYERALGLNSKAAAALNNRGVLLVSGSSQEDWVKVIEAKGFFKEALKRDELFLAAKFNLGALYNYYRLFEVAKPYWQQVLALAPQPDVFDGMAISEQGLGNFDQANRYFKKSDTLGGDPGRFHLKYHAAAKVSEEDPSKCFKLSEFLPDLTTYGYEKQAAQTLNEYCKNNKKR